MLQLLKHRSRRGIVLVTTGAFLMAAVGAVIATKVAAEEMQKGFVIHWLNPAQWMCYDRCLAAPCCFIF